jgi:hypothetical protein
MRRDPFFLWPCRVRFDYIAERLIGRRAAESTGPIFAQIVLYPALDGLPQHDPWLPHRPRHHAHAVEFVVCVLRTVAAAHRHGEPGDVATQLKAAFGHGVRDDVREQRIAGNNHVAARHEHASQLLAELFEEIIQAVMIFFVEDREAWHCRPFVTVERRRNAPHAAATFAELRLLFVAVFEKAVWRIGDDCVNGALFHLRENKEAVAIVQFRFADRDKINR